MEQFPSPPALTSCMVLLYAA